jgi:hypothetical protein
MVCRVETLCALHSDCVPEGPAQIGIEYTCGQLCMYMQRIPVEIQTATHWHIIIISSSSSTTAPQGVLSPSIILPLFSSHCVFNPTHVFQKYYFSISLLFKKLCKSNVSWLELCNAGTSCMLTEITRHWTESSCESLWLHLTERPLAA